MLNFTKRKEIFFKNKTILITGGTGFLGKALIQEILKHNPKNIEIGSIVSEKVLPVFKDTIPFFEIVNNLKFENNKII